jgi:hypothetical protein
MVLYRRQNNPDDMVSPKQREELEKKKVHYATEFNSRLDSMPDSHDKQRLLALRDHYLSKFPIFPVDLSVWLVAYYEDWLKEYNAVKQYQS